MSLPRRRFMQALSIASWGAAAQGRAAGRFPDRPVTLVVPQPPGGDADAVCRSLQARMQEVLGQSVIIDNRAGAAGNIGVAYGAKAPADGHTVTFVNQGILAFNPTLYPQLGFNPAQLMPVTWLTSTDLVLCASPASKIRSLPELLQQARQSPGRITYGTAGNGSANHIATKLLEARAQVQLNHVPYKGGAPAIVDALGGQLDAVMAFPMAAMPHIKAGKLIPLAVTGAQRAKALPQVPTVAECGVAGYEFSSWFGLMVPRGTPEAAIERLHAAASAAVRQPETVDKLRANLTEPVGAGPQEFAALIAREARTWPPLLRQYGIRVD